MAFSGCLDSLVHIHGNDVGVAPTKGAWSKFLRVLHVQLFNYRRHPTGISGSATDLQLLPVPRKSDLERRLANNMPHPLNFVDLMRIISPFHSI